MYYNLYRKTKKAEELIASFKYYHDALELFALMPHAKIAKNNGMILADK